MFSTHSRTGSIAQSATGLAVASAMSWIPIRVFWRELMAVNAMSLAALVCACLRTRGRDILGNRYGAQVRRVDAQPISAKVVNHESIRDDIPSKFVRNTVGFPFAKRAITAKAQSADPLPAVAMVFRLQNTLPKFWREWWFVDVGAMAATETRVCAGWIAVEGVSASSADVLNHVCQFYRIGTKAA